MSATITRDELRALIDAGEVTVVEALPPMYYDDAHLPGAVRLNHDEVTERHAEVLGDTEAQIVTYCSNLQCQNSHSVAEQLRALGYVNVRRYAEGKDDWVAAGLPVVSSARA